MRLLVYQWWPNLERTHRNKRNEDRRIDSNEMRPPAMREVEGISKQWLGELERGSCSCKLQKRPPNKTHD